MTVGHQPNTHSPSEANLAACVELSAALAGQPLVDLEVVLCLLVPRRTHFIPALQSVWIGNGAVISCLITLNTQHCNPTLCLGNSGLGMVTSYLCWFPLEWVLRTVRAHGKGRTLIINKITAWTISQLLWWAVPRGAEERKQIKSAPLWKFPSSLNHFTPEVTGIKLSCCYSPSWSERAVKMSPWVQTQFLSVPFIAATLQVCSSFHWPKLSPSAVRCEEWHKGQRSWIWLFWVLAHGLIEIWGIAYFSFASEELQTTSSEMKPFEALW